MLNPAPEPSPLQVAQIVLIPEGLPLERDIEVSLSPRAVLEPADDILSKVPDVKRDDQHLSLLMQVNAFMIERALGGTFSIAQEYERPEGKAYIAFAYEVMDVKSKGAKLNHSAPVVQ
jgi:hypothetical protein